MRTYNDARIHSLRNPTEQVEYILSNSSTGILINGKREGLCRSKNEHAYWYSFLKSNKLHGEYKHHSTNGCVISNYFNINNERVEELDYLVNEPRDDAFYVTLALYGIDKEYTIEV